MCLNIKMVYINETREKYLKKYDFNSDLTDDYEKNNLYIFGSLFLSMAIVLYIRNL